MKFITTFLLALLTIMPSFAVEYSNEQLYDLWEKHFYGKDVAEDELLALCYLREAAGKDYAPAQCTLGELYIQGIIIYENDSLAVSWFQKASDSQYYKAQVHLGSCYFKGQGVAVNDSIAYSLFSNVVEHGDSLQMGIAEYCIAVMYENGIGKQEDISTAIEWYTKAANHGDVDAMAQLGVMYVMSGKANQNLSKGLEWIQKAVAYNHPIAQRLLGIMYSVGAGIEENEEKSIKYLVLAANQDDLVAIVEAGKTYYRMEDYSSAYKYLKMGVDRNDASCQALLGIMYFSDKGLEKDFPKAIELFNLAADQGVVEAYTMLGIGYAEGMGVEKDMDKAKALFKHAIENGSENAKNVFNKYF